ncbi:asparagine synthase (glutamine-hydrolyzing) [Marinirhabdus gelatinilytica]|uniref:asparagine synthase (glutamine-hydrolyzing) n=1 Tax=Marinirhabdus gelatinilytica TaxID=1703343 RepID=A0A370Q8V5_9FLAO|nr:asparagine synthase (glutamine-hydrolyzing) [Marinirhabdus gelatinilytica]RDK84811.1 asparagine synthase (glutamine-hydrolysing) [Marinirhabdus gelatinilytica]
MCGFLGEFCFQDTPTTETTVFKNLLRLSQHRGPDHSQVNCEETFQLGFNRLAVIDITEAGNQPKISPSNRYHIVFNGEIYNYQSLKKKYKLKNLSSTSDTEVILHLLDSIGVSSTIELLNGMFALAIVDVCKESVFLARDFAGIKPHFYGICDKGLVFASQFDQIFKHPFFSGNLTLNVSTVKEYFGLGYMPSPNTIYNKIHQINPGEFLEITKKGKINRSSYCVLSKQKVSKIDETSEDNSEIYNKLLEDVVARQMVSDVPLASFLSGGIDSPLVSAVAHNQSKNLKAYTVGVDDLRFDESEKAKQYANILGVKQQSIRISEDEIIGHIDEHFKFYSEPFGDYSSIPTYLICKKAKIENTVMLSGDGGDELFFGYQRMLQTLKNRNWFKVPFRLRKQLIRLSNKIGFTGTFGPYYYKTMGDWILARHHQIFPNELEKMFPKINLTNATNSLYRNNSIASKKDLLHWLRWNEFYGHMQRVLIKVDRASMGNSLEVRVPFLDKESIDFSWKYFPLSFNDSDDLKSILKKCLQVFIPRKIIQTSKKGFTVPIDTWLKGVLREDLEKTVLETPFYGSETINVSEVRKFVTNYLNGKHNAAWGVWHIYAWQKWASIHVSD